MLSAEQIRLMRMAGAASVAVATILIGLKLWAWLATDSVSLLGSLADSLLDVIASLITFFAVRVAVAPPDYEHRFGRGKSEAIAGLMQAVIVLGSAVYVATEAFIRLSAPAQISAPFVGITVMVVSVLLTLLLLGFQRYVISKTGSLAISADATHYKADILTNVGVLAAIYLNYGLGWYVADPLLGLLIVGVIFVSVRTIAIQAVDVLLDRELPPQVHKSIFELAANHSAVLGVHDIRTRSSGARQFIQFHLELDPDMTLTEAHEICDEVERRLLERFPSAEVLIHADPFGLFEQRDAF